MVIESWGLSKSYGPVLAVDQLDLRVPAGQIYALLGLNGAGKTTTIRILLGMIRPTAGRVALFGRPVTRDRSVWSRVGYLVESPTAYPELTVRENLDVVCRLRRVADRRAVDEVIDRLALGGYAGRRAGTLSLGNAQRLGLAKALLHRPELLVLDEPANGLDPAGVVEIRNLLRDLARERGTTVFLSSHVLAEVARLATRIGIIQGGRLLQEIDAAELAGLVRRRLVVAARDRTAARAALAGAGLHAEPVGHDTLAIRDERAVDRPDDVAALLVTAGCPPTRLLVDSEDLESYFLRLIGLAGDGEGEAAGDKVPGRGAERRA